MLIKNYYNILSSQTTDAETIYCVALNKECDVYRGHFPTEPISPGVCNIQMLRELAEQTLGQSLRIRAISQCRLTALITPITHPEVEVHLSIQPADNIFKLIATIQKDGNVCLSLKAEMENE